MYKAPFPKPSSQNRPAKQRPTDYQIKEQIKIAVDHLQDPMLPQLHQEQEDRHNILVVLLHLHHPCLNLLFKNLHQIQISNH